MECCANCIYCQFKGKDEKHLGANQVDWWCNYYQKWLHNSSGKCSKYEPN